MLPPEHIKWFSEQPDSIVLSQGIRNERHAIGYLHCGTEYTSTAFFVDRIAGDSLTRKLDKLQAPMYEEMGRYIDQIFGMDDSD